MYRFNIDLKEELLSGIRINYIAEQLNISKVNLYDVLRGARKCSKIYAYGLVKFLKPDEDIDKYFRKDS